MAKQRSQRERGLKFDLRKRLPQIYLLLLLFIVKSEAKRWVKGEHPSVMVESYHIERTEQSHSRTRSHVSYDQKTRKLQQEIDRMHRRLRWRKHDKRSLSPRPSDGSRGGRDRLYHHRSRTPSSKSYSSLELQFLTTNNKVEQKQVLSSLDLAKIAGAMSAVIHCDSQVVVRHHYNKSEIW